MDKINLIKQKTDELLKKMINNFDLEVIEENGVFNIVIKTKDEASTVIGRRGETIRALQKILEVIFYKKFNEPVSILVNVNDYREKQKERLESIVEQATNQVKETKKPVFLKNLSSFERRIVHQMINEKYPELVSHSEDFGKERRVIVELKKDKDE